MANAFNSIKVGFLLLTSLINEAKDLKRFSIFSVSVKISSINSILRFN